MPVLSRLSGAGRSGRPRGADRAARTVHEAGPAPAGARPAPEARAPRLAGGRGAPRALRPGRRPAAGPRRRRRPTARGPRPPDPGGPPRPTAPRPERPVAGTARSRFEPSSAPRGRRRRRRPAPPPPPPRPPRPPLAGRSGGARDGGRRGPDATAGAPDLPGRAPGATPPGPRSTLRGETALADAAGPRRDPAAARTRRAEAARGGARRGAARPSDRGGAPRPARTRRPGERLRPARRPLARPAPGRRGPLPAPARPTQPSEPILLPKLRIRLADFPYLHCSIDQRLFTLETGCGYGYDPRRRSTRSPAFSGAGRSSPDAAGDAALCGAAVPSSGRADSREPAPHGEKTTLPGAPAGVCGLAGFAARTAAAPASPRGGGDGDGGLRLRVREY